jgi:hypothetical protein
MDPSLLVIPVRRLPVREACGERKGMKTTELCGLAAVVVLVTIASINPLIMAAEGDLDNYCRAWDVDCGAEPFLPCPGPEISTNEHLMDFEVFFGVPGQDYRFPLPEAEVRIINRNPGP